MGLFFGAEEVINFLNPYFVGYWFDGSRPLTYVSHSEDFFYAPDFVLRNAELYKHLLFVDT